MILKTITVRPFSSNCYLVGCESTRKGMIVDPGAEPGSILAAVAELGLTVSLIVATHGHIDHVGAVQAIREETGAPFAMHELESGNPYIERMTERICRMLDVASEPPSPPDRLVGDGEILEVGDLRFTVIHVPGHSDGGLALYGNGVVFSGDTLFQFDVGQTNFPGGSHRAMMAAICDKLLVLPDDTIVYPGHGLPTVIHRERDWNPFVQAWRRDG